MNFKSYLNCYELIELRFGNSHKLCLALRLNAAAMQKITEARDFLVRNSFSSFRLEINFIGEKKWKNLWKSLSRIVTREEESKKKNFSRKSSRNWKLGENMHKQKYLATFFINNSEFLSWWAALSRALSWRSTKKKTSNFIFFSLLPFLVPFFFGLLTAILRLRLILTLLCCVLWGSLSPLDNKMEWEN